MTCDHRFEEVRLEKHLQADLNNPEALEVELIQMGHTLSMSATADPAIRATGRAIKHLAPAMCSFLAEQNDRESGRESVANYTNAMCNWAVLSIGMALAAGIAEHNQEEAVEETGKMFAEALRRYVLKDTVKHRPGRMPTIMGPKIEC